LEIQIGPQDIQTLAEGIGLAFSFVAFTNQLRAP
jgi:hypothetical protein